MQCIFEPVNAWRQAKNMFSPPLVKLLFLEALQRLFEGKINCSWRLFLTSFVPFLYQERKGSTKVHNIDCNDNIRLSLALIHHYLLH